VIVGAGKTSLHGLHCETERTRVQPMSLELLDGQLLWLKCGIHQQKM